jgi:hypothetical protein
VTDEAGTEEFPELEVPEEPKPKERTPEAQAAKRALFLRNMEAGRQRVKAEKEARAAAGETEPLSTAPPPKRPKGSPPRRSRARVPLSELFEGTLGLAGGALMMSGRDIPVGQALSFEAPVAGEKLDAIIAGTMLDRLLQPIARAGGLAKDVGAVLALPLLVALIERRPYLYDPLKPFILPIVTSVALDLAEMQERNKERLKEAQAKAGGAQIDVEALMAMLFQGAPPPGYQPAPTPPQAAPVEEPIAA